MAGSWVAAECDLCQATDARTVLTVAHPDAPGGESTVVQCVGCGLRRLAPRPGPESIGSYYEQGYYAFAGRTRGALKQWLWDVARDVSSGAPGRGQRLAFLGPVARPMAARTFDINVPLDGVAERRVVEVGCGFGDVLMYLQSRGCRVQGVDLDRRAAEMGREYGVPIHVGELEDLALPPSSVDVVIMSHSLEHLPSPLRILRECARVLRSGGTIHLAVPNGASVGFRLEGGSWWALMHPVHFWYFDRVTLRRLLDAAGFDVATVRFRSLYCAKRVWHATAGGGPRPASSRWRHAGRLAWGFLRDPTGGDILRVVGTRRGPG